MVSFRWRLELRERPSKKDKVMEWSMTSSILLYLLSSRIICTKLFRSLSVRYI